MRQGSLFSSSDVGFDCPAKSRLPPPTRPYPQAHTTDDVLFPMSPCVRRRPENSSPHIWNHSQSGKLGWFNGMLIGEMTERQQRLPGSGIRHRHSRKGHHLQFCINGVISLNEIGWRVARKKPLLLLLLLFRWFHFGCVYIVLPESKYAHITNKSDQ